MQDTHGYDGPSQLLENALTRQVIGAFFDVYNAMGPGFLESVYSNALLIALGEKGITARTEIPLIVRYRDRIVGHFRADLLVENRIIVEVKAVARLAKAHEAQLVNYLRATGIAVGLVLNFGPRAEFRRRVCTFRSSPPLSAPSA
jgi:GxxExxY protein